MSDKFQRFGKYLILDHLVDGGMAKICRARYLGEQANKVVAIKMVQPQFSNDEAFVRMFQDELNITFGMLHPNIMQVYDYGKTNGQLYTAMEYIHGANLKQYLDRLKEKKVVFPVEISCYIISQVCLGLHYAHTFTDKLTGKPYNIVHRDISPHNIMLTYDGAVKVIDFGIAKANTNSEATQAGTIKGKLSYLAPEYLDGLELDARYDEFAVGITLWEMLCSRKLFQANNDLAVLKQIQACKIVPPSQINPSVPKELDQIVMKALAKDRSHRYENLDQLNRALIKFLYSTYPEFNASDLKTFADDLFKKEITSDQSKFVEYGKIDTTPYIEDLKKEESRTGKIARKEMEGIKEKKDAKPKERVGTVRMIEMEVDAAAATGIGIELRAERTATRKLNAAKADTAKNGAPQSEMVKGMTSKSKVSSTANPLSSKKAQDKTNSRIIKKPSLESKEDSASMQKVVLLAMAISFAALAYFKGDMVESVTGFNLYKIVHGSGDASPTRTITSVPSNDQAADTQPDAPTTGRILFSGVSVEMEVYIDNQKADYVGSPLKIPLNTEVTVMVKQTGHMPFVTKVTLTADNTSTKIEVPTLKRARVGLLTTSQNYAAGSKLIYGNGDETVERDLPFKDLPIAEGTYQAKVVNPILGTEKKVEFTIEENKKHFLE